MDKEKAKRPCASCGTELMGKFCHNCGEKKVSRKDFSASSISKEVLNKFTHLDPKFLRSFWLLVSHPGFLTREFLNGRRKTYLKPLSLFFIVNLLYFLTIGLNGLRTFETPLRVQLLNPYRSVVEKMLSERLVAETDEERLVFETKFDQKNHVLAKAMLVLMVPMLAVVLWLLYVWRGVYFGEHLITGLHFQALIIVQNMVLGIFLSGSLTNFVFGYTPNSHFVNEIMEPLLWIWLLAFFTLKTVYQESWPRTILKAAAVALAWMPILVLYRFMVFLATFYSI